MPESVAESWSSTSGREPACSPVPCSPPAPGCLRSSPTGDRLRGSAGRARMPTWSRRWQPISLGPRSRSGSSRTSRSSRPPRSAARCSEIPRSRCGRPILIVEWDLAAKRARLWPSTVAGVVWGAWYELSVARRLPPELFVPRPSVAAGVLRATRRAAPLVDPASAGTFERFVRRGFARGGRELDAYGWARRFQAAAGRNVRSRP